MHLGTARHRTCCTPTAAHRALLPHLPLASSAAPRRDVRAARVRADQLVLGRVATGVPGAAEAGGIAIGAGRIIGVGAAADLEGLVGPDTQIVTQADGVIAPGFVDPHMHVFTTSAVYWWPDCSPVANPTFDGLIERLRGEAAKAADGQWVHGKAFDPSLYDGEPNLTREILDRVSTDRPIFVLNASMHFGYANTKALELAGVPLDAQDPPGGIYGRNADGSINGVLGDAALGPIFAILPRPDAAQFARTILAILNEAAAAGITSVREAATGAVSGPGELAMLRHLYGQAPLPVRVSTAQWAATGMEAWQAAGVTAFEGDDMLRSDAWKVVTDGSNQGRSGYFKDSYLGTDNHGHATLTPEQIVAQMTAGLDAGYQVMVHANGDAAVSLTVDAYREALAGHRAAGLRHRIEHVSFASKQDFEAMAELGVSPSFLMNHLYYWGRVFRDNILGPERADRLDMVGSALAAGLRPSLHSDYNVTPFQPLVSAKTAATRVMRDNGEVLNPAECVTADQALTAVTTDAAWQIHADDRGTLQVGNAADYTVLSDNPWTTEPDAWPEITVLQTAVGGRVTYQA